MIGKAEFERWIEASHAMFEIFEGRYDAHPLAVKWIDEWFVSGGFTIEEEQVNRISTLAKNFRYEVYGVGDELKERINGGFTGVLRDQLQKGRKEHIGFAASPYLFTWNFRRFKEYFKRPDFNLQQYFGTLSEFLTSKKEKLGSYRSKSLVTDRIDEDTVKAIFQEVNSKLKAIGIGNNEPVGTIKLLHVIAPSYFPLIDNDIAEAVGLVPRKPKWKEYRVYSSLTNKSYLQWMNSLKIWLQNYVEVIEGIVKRHKCSILKLVDEGLYMMSTVKQSARVATLGIEVK